MGELIVVLLLAWGILYSVAKLGEVVQSAREASVRDARRNLREQERELENREKKLEKEKNRTKKKLQEEREQIEQDRAAVLRLEAEKAQGFPWLAEAYGDYRALKWEKRAKRLWNKKWPAPKAAEEVRAIKSELRDVEKKFRVVRDRLRYYETLFPWLTEDFIRDSSTVDELLIAVQADEGEDSEQEPETDPAKYWLTTEEWKKLSTVEKNELAFKRWKNRDWSRWEVGKQYERYIGYRLEKNGYRINYKGITDRLEDLGRDLIARKGGQVQIVQCKRWSQHKEIHEKHVFQLFGTCVEYLVKQGMQGSGPQLELAPDVLRASDIDPIFVTSSTLSDMAQAIADTLGIEVREEVAYDDDYPMIKCNVSYRDEEKIYHLPFDQQYDRVHIEPRRGECYVSSVREAEQLEFRRAWRWRPGPED